VAAAAGGERVGAPRGSSCSTRGKDAGERKDPGRAMFGNNYSTIKCDLKDSTARITLCRPEVHNAFNETMIAELREVIAELQSSRDVRVVVITGEGKSFCAGADLNWMKRVIDFSFEDNLKDSLALSELMHGIYSLKLPTVAMVNGAAIGGGMGFVATCDIVVAASHAKFSLSEVKLGLVPACISPFVIRKAGEAACRRFMLTGERLTAETAKAAGLVNEVVEPDELEGAVSELVDRLLSSGPNAVAVCKQLLREVPAMSLEEAKKATAESLARLRVSEEGQEGMKAFLEKRKPRWSLKE
jgi:methylglutaconyl-CoA hydratase